MSRDVLRCVPNRVRQGVRHTSSLRQPSLRFSTRAAIWTPPVFYLDTRPGANKPAERGNATCRQQTAMPSITRRLHSRDAFDLLLRLDGRRCFKAIRPVVFK